MEGNGTERSFFMIQLTTYISWNFQMETCYEILYHEFFLAYLKKQQPFEDCLKHFVGWHVIGKST